MLRPESITELKKGYKVGDIYTVKDGDIVHIKNGSKIKPGNMSVIYIQVEDAKGNRNFLGLFQR